MYWEAFSYFKRFKEFALKMPVVNDHAERSVGMVHDFVKVLKDEEEKQDLLIAVDRTRFCIRQPGRPE